MFESGLNRLDSFFDALPEWRPYCPQGSHIEVIRARESEVIAEGPAGTGKSRAKLEKIHLCCEKYPGCRVLIARQTRQSLTDTTLVTFEEWVLPTGHAAKTPSGRENRHSYKYLNGSEIVLMGFDDPQKLMSSEFDLIYVPECKEIEESSWEKASTRLRNGRMPYQQMLGDTNPDHPDHWIQERSKRGSVRLITTTHKDNPRLWDALREDWTPEGKRYIEVLSNLTGHERDRLYLGLWVAAEGARFPQLHTDIHNFRARDVWPNGIYPGAKILIGMDYGLRAPYCALWTLIDSDGDFWTYREDYQSGLTSDKQAQRVLNMTAQNERIHSIFADPACWANFPGHQGPTNKCTADYYLEEFRKDARFGGLQKGFNKERRHALDTLDKLLNEGRWHIDKEACPHLWRELSAATWDSKREAKEDIDQKCDDHAITAAYYHLHTWMYPPAGPVKPLPPPEVIAKAQFEQDVKNEYRRFRKTHRL